MFRKIEIWYSMYEGEVTFDVTETTSVNWKNTSYTYKIKDFKEWYKLYNRALDDFQAEFDEEISRGLEEIVKLFWKEVE